MHPANLPPAAKRAFDKHFRSPILWPVVVQEAVKAGVRSSSDLADIVFYMHHPERIGNPIQAGETKLIEQWKGFRTMVRPMIQSSSKPASGSKSGLGGLLKAVDISKLATNSKHRRHLEKMQKLLASAVAGDPVDDRYWQFTFFDGFGRERNCAEKHSVMSLKRHTPQQNALKNFKRCVDKASASTAGEVGKCLVQTEAAVACHTFAVIRWTHQNAGTGDASIKPYTEYGYLRALVSRAKQSSPVSIYSCYKDELQTTLRHAS